MKEITAAHKKAILERYREAFQCNDVQAFEMVGKIRQRAYELGYTADQVSDLLKELRG